MALNANPAGTRDFSLHLNVQNVSGTHTASCSHGTDVKEVKLKWLKRSEPKVNLSPPSGPDVKNKWSFISAAPVCLQGAYTDNRTFTFYCTEENILPIKNTLRSSYTQDETV